MSICIKTPESIYFVTFYHFTFYILPTISAQLEALKMINLGHVFCAGTDVKQMPYDVYRAFPEV